MKAAAAAILGFLLVLGGLAFAAPDADVEEAVQDVLDMEEELVRTCDRIRKLTVSVWNLQIPKRGGKPIEGAAPRPAGFGSGVVIERKGKLWVITNVHVVQGADEVHVTTWDGERHLVTVHDAIPEYDFALLAFPKRPRGLKGYTLNPSKVKVSKSIEEGAWVVATGNPFGLGLDGRAVTTLGVLSGRDRILGGRFLYGNALQHDAEVNPGNSGGPVWNRRGDLVGINGMIMTRPRERGTGPSNTGASFSIPIHQVNAYMMAMIESGTDADAGWLGIAFETATGDRGSPVGARVKGIEPNSPVLGKRGIQVGDVVVSIWALGESHRMRTASDLTNLMSLCRAGTFLKVKYRRGKRYYEWKGRLPAAPKGRRRR